MLKETFIKRLLSRKSKFKRGTNLKHFSTWLPKIFLPFDRKFINNRSKDEVTIGE